MRKLFAVSMLLLGLVAYSTKLDAGQCSGGDPVYWFTTSDWNNIINHSDLNCCAGSIIELYNPYIGTTTTHTVTENGANSSWIAEP